MSAKPKPNKKAVYRTRARQKKAIIIWIPHTLDVSDIDNTLSLLISNIDATPINTSLYQNSFRIFYEREISKYDNRVHNTAFCISAQTSGVSIDYLINTANNQNKATILSVDMDENGDITEVYALLTFHISHKKLAVRVDTLCGNKVLPSSGEGSRLLKILEKNSYDVGIDKIALDPLDDAIPFYQQNKYRFFEKGDSPVSLKSYDSSDSSDSSDVSGPMIQMQKNIAAQKRWNKIKTYVDMSARIKKSKNATEKRTLQERYKQMQEEEVNKRPVLTGKPINSPGSSLKSSRKGFVPNPARKTRKIPSVLIEPGATFNAKNAKDSYLLNLKKQAEKGNAKGNRITRRRRRIR
jgi:hypothetical protein